MFDQKVQEVAVAQRRKILLVALRPCDQSLISTFLVSMGCTCTMVSSEDAPVILEREVFDAIVLALGPFDAQADKFILRLKQISPGVASRVVVITNSVADRETIELIERHDLRQVSQERLVPQLWTILQELFISRRSWQLPVRNMGIPRLIFDSSRSPMTAGVRSLSPAGVRQLAYQHKSTVIDLSIGFLEGPGLISLAGQVLDAERKGMTDGLSVLLVSGVATLVRTATNQFGEFHLVFESAENVSLEIRLGQRSWVLVPLGKMDWARKRILNSQTGS